MKRLILVLSILLITALVAFYIRFKFSNNLTVSVVPTSRGTIISSIKATGKVISRREAALCASAPAQVVRVNVIEGQAVTVGTVLAVLDDREARERMVRCNSRISETGERVEQQRKHLDGLRKVYEAGGASLQSLKDAETELNVLRAAKKQAEAEARSAAILLEDVKVKAPFTGIVTRKGINAGEWAAPGVPLFSLVDPEEREIEVMVEESDAGLITAGQPVEISCDAVPGAIWRERISHIDPAIRKEGNTSSISVRVSLARNSRNLRFGQQVDAKILTAKKTDVIKLPFDALISKDGKTFVAIVPDGSIHLKPVVTGIEDSTHVEIAEGLKTGQEVVLPEGNVLKEGQRVKGVRRDTDR